MRNFASLIFLYGAHIPTAPNASLQKPILALKVRNERFNEKHISANSKLYTMQREKTLRTTNLHISLHPAPLGVFYCFSRIPCEGTSMITDILWCKIKDGGIIRAQYTSNSYEFNYSTRIQ